MKEDVILRADLEKILGSYDEIQITHTPGDNKQFQIYSPEFGGQDYLGTNILELIERVKNLK